MTYNCVLDRDVRVVTFVATNYVKLYQLKMLWRLWMIKCHVVSYYSNFSWRDWGKPREIYVRLAAHPTRSRVETGSSVTRSMIFVHTTEM